MDDDASDVSPVVPAPRPMAATAPAHRAGRRCPSPSRAEMPTISRPAARTALRNAGSCFCAAGSSSLLATTRVVLDSSRGSRASSSSRMISKSRSGFGGRHVHDVDQHPRPLDVAQECVAEPCTRTGALDQARQVRERRRRWSAGSRTSRSRTPRLGSRVVNGYVGDARRCRRERPRGGSTCRRWAARPVRRPRSAAAPARSAAPRPGLALWACLGAWCVEVVKWVLPRPPRPPRATMKRWPGDTRSASRSPVAPSNTTVPGGTVSSRSVPGLAMASRSLAAAAIGGAEMMLEAVVTERGLADVDDERRCSRLGHRRRHRDRPAGRAPHAGTMDAPSPPRRPATVSVTSSRNISAVRGADRTRPARAGGVTRVSASAAFLVRWPGTAALSRSWRGG